jgi:hypothetical protein
MHTEDLELQRVDSEGDFSDQVFGLEDSKRKLESEKHSAETARSSQGAPRRAPVIPPAKGHTQMLGLQPSVTTEIKASTPEPPEKSSGVPDHGITVHRDVVIDQV